MPTKEQALRLVEQGRSYDEIAADLGIPAGQAYAATRRMERRLGMVAEPLKHGTSGRLVRLGGLLSLGRAAAGATLGRRSRAAAGLAGAALLAGSALTRFGLFHAGKTAARDPKYTVEPQRERSRP